MSKPDPRDPENKKRAWICAKCKSDHASEARAWLCMVGHSE